MASTEQYKQAFPLLETMLICCGFDVMNQYMQILTKWCFANCVQVMISTKTHWTVCNNDVSTTSRYLSLFTVMRCYTSLLMCVKLAFSQFMQLLFCTILILEIFFSFLCIFVCKPAICSFCLMPAVSPSA